MQQEISPPKSEPPAGTPRAAEPDVLNAPAHSSPPIVLPSALELKIKQAIGLATGRGKYLVAVWSVGTEPDAAGKLPLDLDLFRHNLPSGDFNECARMLHEDLMRMAQG